MAEIFFLSDKKIDEYYTRQVSKLEGHCMASPGGPYRWRYSFEDVLASCLRYLEGRKIAKKYKYIESFTQHAYQAIKIINDREYVRELKLHERRLSKIFIKCVCIERISRESSSSPEKRKEFIDLYEKYINFYIPTSKFTQSELDKIRFYGKQSFGRRWSGYENFG
jgi:hypothetical protein